MCYLTTFGRKQTGQGRGCGIGEEEMEAYRSILYLTSGTEHRTVFPEGCVDGVV